MNDTHQADHKRLLQSASIITLITLLSRVFGYIRDQRLAFLLGTGSAADAFTTAYRIPNLLRRLVGEGAVSAAFIPVFSKYLAEGKREEAFRFANALLTLVSLLLAVVTVIGIVIAPLIVQVLAFGFNNTPGKVELTTWLSRLMFPYIFFVSLSALSMGVLNSFHRFAAPAFAPVLLNLTFIGASIVAAQMGAPETILAVGVVVGGVLQVAIQVPGLRRCGWTPKLLWETGHPGVRRALTLMAPVVFGAGIVQINVVVDTQFSSTLQEGSVVALYLADRVMELVLGGYAIAISTAVLPLMSRQAAESRIDQLVRTVNFSIRLVLFITIPSTVGLILLREPIIEVLFQHGDFTAASTALTARPLMYFAIGLSAFSLMKVIVPAFYSMHDTKTPVRIAFASLIVNIALNFAFIGPLENGGPALATSLAAVFSSLGLLIVFRSRHGALGMVAVAQSALKFTAAAVVMGGVAVAFISWPGAFAGGTMQRALVLAGAIASAAGAYFGTMLLIGSREIAEIRGMFQRRHG